MTIELRLASHTLRRDTLIAEVVADGNVIATIVPHATEPRIRIISAHILNRADSIFLEVSNGVPAFNIIFRPGEYEIVNGNIVRVDGEDVIGTAGVDITP